MSFSINKEVVQSTSPTFEQNAQDMLEGFTEEYPNWRADELRCDSPLYNKVMRNITKKRPQKRSYLKQHHSYVMKSSLIQGRRLIKIEVLDLEKNHTDPLLCAQYVVTEHIDPIMDQTEAIISNISKKVCGYSYSF